MASETKAIARERRVWWHRGRGDHSGTTPFWRYGRFWLHFGSRGCLNVEWNLFRFQFNVGFATGGDEQDVQVHVGLPGLGSVWITLSGVLPYQRLDRTWPRRTDVRVFASKVWVSLLCQDHVWPHEKGWSWTIDPARILLGRQTCTREILSESEHRIPMPEASYAATIQMVRFRWSRPRWPFAKTIIKADVDIPEGIPHPGKGTAAYNCGPDATYGMCCPARDPEEAIGKVVESVTRDRRRYPL